MRLSCESHKAGLFSAVLTAFLVGSYQGLQQQPGDITNQILVHISHQLSNIGSLNSTLSPFIIPSFTPSHSSIRVNTLWTLSLITSLFTASLGIFMKQWLHQFVAQNSIDPMERVKIRIFRFEGVKRWGVYQLAAALPLLLQLALLLFLIGLSELLRYLNPLVGWVITGSMVLWLIVIVMMTLIPLFDSQCPYKSQFLKNILCWLRNAIVEACDQTWKSLPEHLQLSSTDTPTLSQRASQSVYRWVRWSKSREEDIVCKDPRSHMAFLVYAQEALQGELLLGDTISICSLDCRLDQMDECTAAWSTRSPSQWLPPLRSSGKLITSQIYLNIIGTREASIPNNQTSLEVYPAHDRHLTFAIHNVLVNQSKNSAYSLQAALKRLIQCGSETTLLGCLSFYRAMRRVVIAKYESWDDTPIAEHEQQRSYCEYYLFINFDVRII